MITAAYSGPLRFMNADRIGKNYFVQDRRELIADIDSDMVFENMNSDIPPRG